MKETTLLAHLTLLNYTKEWLDYGLLSPEKLEEQVVEFSKGEDIHTEHYRYAILRDYLKACKIIENDALDKLIDILRQDNDKAMASSVTIDLLKMDFLNEEQVKKVGNFLLTFSDKMLK